MAEIHNSDTAGITDVKNNKNIKIC